MSESSITGSDNMVAEYLLYRGFTQTFQVFESEKNRDKTKRFDVSRIVETIFHDLNNFEIENHVLFWDFLSKRFFFHLDAEHLSLCAVLKIDLLKYYLVNSYKTKNKEKIVEFFSMYSHEILAESADYIPGNLRAWFALPYLDEPEKDVEFTVYFTQKWADMLKITLHNFLSIVLSTAPPPKLIILERWFRSDAQQETRTQLKRSSQQIECLLARLERSEDRLRDLRGVVKDLSEQLLLNYSEGSPVSAEGERGQDELLSRKQRLRDVGQSVVKLSGECAKKTLAFEALSKEERLRIILGKDGQLLFPDGEDDHQGQGSPPIAEREVIEQLESNLVVQLQRWLNAMMI
eukprot:gene26040-34644_t